MTIKHLRAMLSQFNEDRIVKVIALGKEYDLDDSIEEDFLAELEDGKTVVFLVLKKD